MYYENHFYGHALILASYAALGFDTVGTELPSGEAGYRRIPRRIRPPIIPGHLQHGWVPVTPFSDRKRRVFRGFVWNGRSLDQHQRSGDSKVIATGAPFLYLRRAATVLGLVHAEGTTPTPDQSERHVLVYPFHVSLRAPALGRHDLLVKALLDRGLDGATVCLAVGDFVRPDVRREYESSGFLTICNGPRTDPHFLVRQYATLQSYDHVVTNRVATALWYAGALGRHIEVLGESWGTRSEREGREFDDIQRRFWPSLFEGGVSGSAAVELSEIELGASFVREPEALAALFGWDRWFTRLRNLLLRTGWDARVQVRSMVQRTRASRSKVTIP